MGIVGWSRPAILHCNTNGNALTEQKRKDTDMTTALAATSAAGILTNGAERRTPTPLAIVAQAWDDYRAYRATLGELRALSDKQLGDLGFRRDALRQVAAEAVYGK